MTIGTGEIYKKDVFSVRGTDYFGMVKEWYQMEKNFIVDLIYDANIEEGYHQVVTGGQAEQILANILSSGADGKDVRQIFQWLKGSPKPMA